LAVVAGVAALHFTDLLGAAGLLSLRRLALIPGLPLAAVLAAELPLRDGLTHRTLLYPLLGPVGRATLLLVRTAVATVLLALAVGAVVLVLGLLGRAGPLALVRESAAVALAAVAYVSLMGFIHALTRRGLAAGLILLVVIDFPLGRLPFALRALTPSALVRAVAGHPVPVELPLQLPIAVIAPGRAAALLLITALVAFAATALHFARRDLGELC
jgi:hypothetical protein